MTILVRNSAAKPTGDISEPDSSNAEVLLHLAVALAITAGVIITGITGALLIPLATCANAAVKYLVGKETTPTDIKDTVEPLGV
jgi:hypothetical protein